MEFNLSQDILINPCVTLIEAIPGVLGKRGEKYIYFRGTGEQRQYWKTGNIRKQFFDFWDTWEQANLFLGNKEIGIPWEDPIIHVMN